MKKNSNVPKFMAAWTDIEKADFIFELMTTLPYHRIIDVIDRIKPFINRNIVTQLPKEIALHVFSFLDLTSLIQVACVCKSWNVLSSEQSIWRNLFDNQGWGYDQQEIDVYLLNAVDESSEDSNSTTASELSSIAINRSSDRFIPSNLTSRFIPRIKWQPPKTHQNELLDYHYDSKSDTRFINWQRLYQNRYILEKRWIHKDFKIREFPPNTCSQTELHSAEGIYCIQFDKKRYVTGSRDTTIKVWDISGQCKQTIKGHSASVLCLQYDGSTIVSGGSDSNLMVSDMVSGIVRRTLTGHLDSVLGLKLVGKNRVISCSKDRSLRLWDINTGECLRVYSGHAAAVNTIHWKDNIIVSGSGDKTIRIWDLETGECLRIIAAHSRGVACVEYDGKLIISGSSDHTIKVWNAETGDNIYTLVGHTSLVRAIMLDTVGNRIISGCYEGYLKIWCLNEGKLLQDLGKATKGRILGLKSDFSKIVCCSNSYKLVIYDYAYNVNTKFLM